MSTLGWVHVVFGVVALLLGTTVLFTPKGTRRHRTLGRGYLTAMITLNVTSLFIYNLFGRFGPFHWMALASLLTLMVGMLPALTHRPPKTWLALHGGFMAGSYVGLVAATASEITTRIASDELFGMTTAVTSVVIIGVGVYLIWRYLPAMIGRSPVQ